MCLDRVFDDKRLAVGLLMLWMCIVVGVFKDIGLLDSRFMTFGPSPGTVFMGVTLDTWYKWNAVASFTLVNTLVNDFMSDALSPWILNTITDHKTRYIPYSKPVCLTITQCWAVYCNIMGVFGLFLAMTQIDFVLIRMSADLTVNIYTNLKFMRNKETCPERYARSMGLTQDPADGDPSGAPLRPRRSVQPPGNLGDEDMRPMFCIEEAQQPAQQGGDERVRAGPAP